MSYRMLVVLLAIGCGGSGTGSDGGAPFDGGGTDGAGNGADLAQAGRDGGGPPPPSHSLGSCTVFPPYDGQLDDSYWNADVSNATNFPVDALSDQYVASFGGAATHLHPDFGSNPSYGIPFDSVPGTQAKVPMSFDVPTESDPGPYPFPPNAPIEAGSDAHVLVIDRDHCILYEIGVAMYDAVHDSWHGYSGAVFDLKTAGPLRPDTWTSADAAGLPIFPGLARYEEVAAGKIGHALRFTVNNTQHAYVHPATHQASSDTSANRPPMGLRLRLKASACPTLLAGAGTQSKVIVQAMCTYGLILADNGSDLYVSGATDPHWDDNDLGYLKGITGDQFEAIATGPLIKN